jgi:hypothetical protein
MMQVPGAGAFVRCLLPLRLDGGYSITFGVWLAIDPRELQQTFRVWWEPQYVDLVLDGLLANTLPEAGLLGAPVTATVLDPNATPYVTTFSEESVAAVLEREWPHELLASLP